MTTVPKLWPGSTFAILANGPSLTIQDVDYCRGMARVIAVSDAYRLAPWADAIFACDGKWWKWQYRDHKDAITSFAGLRYALQPEARRYAGVQVLRNTGQTGLERDPSGLRTGRNSGYQAINLAVHLGAKRILLLGYDMSLGEGGKKHWFGDHPDQGRPPLTVFRRNFPTIAQPLKDAGIEVVNCSRRSALTCFPKVTLERALRQNSAFSRPASGESIDDSTGGYPSALGPRRDAHSFSADRYKSVVATIAVLLMAVCPPTISGFVASGVVDSVDALSRRSISHVRIEPSELTPLPADRDAGSAVSGIGVIVRVQATADNARPHVVFGSPCFLLRRTVCNVGVGAGTPTARSASARQVTRRDKSSPATPANASPHDRPARSLFGFLNSRQATKNATRNIVPLGSCLAASLYVCSDVSLQATTTPSVAISEVVGDNCDFVAASASAKPSDGTSLASGNNQAADLRDNNKASKLLTDQIQQFRHGSTIQKTKSTCLPQVAA